MRAVKYGALALVAGLSISWLFVQADRISTPRPAPSAAVKVSEPSLGIAPGVGPVKCTEDMSCWNCATMGNRVCGVPAWVSCNLIKDEALWQVCYTDINTYHARWRYLGDYDRHRHVWTVTGPTSVYVNRSGWAESS